MQACVRSLFNVCTVCVNLVTHTQASGYINRNSVPQCFKKLFALLLKQLFRRIVSTALKGIHIEETRDQTLFHSVISFRKEFPDTRNSHICITVRILNRIYSHSVAKISCTYYSARPFYIINNSLYFFRLFLLLVLLLLLLLPFTHQFFHLFLSHFLH